MGVASLRSADCIIVSTTPRGFAGELLFILDQAFHIRYRLAFAFDFLFFVDFQEIVS